MDRAISMPNCRMPVGAINTSAAPIVNYNFNLVAGGENNSRLRSPTYPGGRVPDFHDGAGQTPATRIAHAGTTATITTAFRVVAGQTVVIEGATPAAYDGTFTILTATGSSMAAEALNQVVGRNDPAEVFADERAAWRSRRPFRGRRCGRAAEVGDAERVPAVRAKKQTHGFLDVCGAHRDGMELRPGRLQGQCELCERAELPQPVTVAAASCRWFSLRLEAAATLPV